MAKHRVLASPKEGRGQADNDKDEDGANDHCQEVSCCVGAGPGGAVRVQGGTDVAAGMADISA